MPINNTLNNGKFDNDIDLKSRSLYARLKRLFSTDVVIRNVGGKKLKIKDTDHIQYATDRNSLRDRFNRIRSTPYNQHTKDFNMAYAQSRIELFRDYDVMDMDPIISAALDIYADECVVQNEIGNILTIKSSDDNIKEILENLFYDILNIEFNMWSWVRNMVKYGDFYLRLHINPNYGIIMVEPLSSYMVQRMEGMDPLNKNYVKFLVNYETGNKEELEKFQICHFRLLSDSNFLPYGKSLIEGARRVWKQLSLLEDAMLIHRIMRAPEKRIFKVDVGNIPPHEIDNYMNKLMSQTKKVPYIDDRTGDYNLRFNLQNMIEDFWLPVRGSDSGTSIEPLSGMEFTGIDDIEYIRNKMLAALKIPKAYLSFEEDLSGKATLAAEDLRFAKTIHRLQKIIVSELSKIAIIHLYSQGFEDEDLMNFELEMNNPSTILEKEKISIWQDKMNVAKDMLDSKTFSSEWIYKNVFALTNGDINNVRKQIVEDMKRSWRFKQIEEEGNDPALSMQKVNADGGLEDAEGGFGDEGGGGDEMPPDLGGGGPGGEEPPEGGPGGEGGPEGGPGGEAGGEELAEANKKKRAPQDGQKDARKYPFGEDPLGSLELNSSFKSTRRPGHKYKKNSPLGLDEFLTSDKGKLTEFLKRDTKKELLNERKTTKSLLDETNIINDESNT